MNRSRSRARIAILFSIGSTAASALGCEPVRAEPAARPARTEAPARPEAPPAHVRLAAPVPGKAPPHSYSEEQIRRGGSLVKFGSCNDCHTPWAINEQVGAPMPEMSRMLSGHPEGGPDPRGELGPGDLAVIGPTFTSFRMPFGVVYTPNLTPDIDTGTGSWSEEMFLGIFRKAKHLGGDGRPVLPPMPWPMVASLPDEDLVAIFAYLRSIPPIRNASPVAQPPAPVLEHVAAVNDRMLKLFASH